MKTQGDQAEVSSNSELNVQLRATKQCDNLETTVRNRVECEEQRLSKSRNSASEIVKVLNIEKIDERLLVTRPASPNKTLIYFILETTDLILLSQTVLDWSSKQASRGAPRKGMRRGRAKPKKQREKLLSCI